MYRLMLIVFVMGMLAAAYSDYRRRRIPNYLTLPLLVIGLIANAVFSDGLGLQNALLGICFGGGMFMVLYVCKVMGAGDVKLAAAVGAWIGMPQVLSALFYTVIAGALMAVVQILMVKLRPQMAVQQALIPGSEQSEKRNAPDFHKLTLPYGVAITAGTLYSLFQTMWT